MPSPRKVFAVGGWYRDIGTPIDGDNHSIA
jgi:hypothetical protein